MAEFLTPEFLTIAEAADLIARRKLSPVELVETCLTRIAAHDGTLHSFLLLRADEARAAARSAEAEIMAGGPKGPLHGIPIGLKDIYCTKGIRTTGHSKLLIDYVPTEDSTTGRKLAEAGSIMMGKLATHEFALGGPSFDLPWPPARNPWNPEHFTGGSSSGTGAAVAAGLILAGTGSDTGGSIRGPSAFCGLSGIKPTYGLLSRAGILPLAFSLDHAGPMAWTAEDCAILLQAMAGYDAADPASAKVDIPDYRAGLEGGVKGLKIGVIRHFHEIDNPADAATRAAIDAAIEVYRGLGAEIREVTLSPLQDWAACGWLILSVEAFAVHEPWLKTRYNDYGDYFRDRTALGGLFTAADYVQATRKRRELCAEFTAAMSGLDLMLTASAAFEAPKIREVGKFSSYERPSLTIPFNLTGSPAMSVCTGFSPSGLPLSMQLVGKPFDDVTVLRAAHTYEQSTPWRARRPQL